MKSSAPSPLTRCSDGVHIRLTLTRGVKDHLRDGSAPESIGLDLDHPGRTQSACLREDRADLNHQQVPARPSPEILDCKIHHANLLNSILAKIEANNAGADDALMLDTRGFVAETNATACLHRAQRRRGHQSRRRLSRKESPAPP